jgi:hypothetical protein
MIAKKIAAVTTNTTTAATTYAAGISMCMTGSLLAYSGGWAAAAVQRGAKTLGSIE